MVGKNAHPTAFLHFLSNLKPFTHKPYGLFGGLETHPTPFTILLSHFYSLIVRVVRLLGFGWG